MHLDPNTVKDALSILNNEQVKSIVSPTTKAMGESLKDFYDATIGENMRDVADKFRERRSGKRPLPTKTSRSSSRFCKARLCSQTPLCKTSGRTSWTAPSTRAKGICPRLRRHFQK